MLLDIFDIPTAYATLGTFSAVGIGLKLLLGGIYKRDIRNARKIEHTKKRWMRRMRRNFVKIFGDGLSRDAELFVENEMHSRMICGVPIKNVDGCINQLPLVILTATMAFDFMFASQNIPVNELVSFTLFGATMCLAVHTFNMMVNNDSKESRLRIILTQYFGNEKLPMILMNQYADENFLEDSGDFGINTLVAVTGERGVAVIGDDEALCDNVSPRMRRKQLKAEKLRLKRLLKQQKTEERRKRREARELTRQMAMRIQYEEKMKKLQEKYKSSPTPAMAAETPAYMEMREEALSVKKNDKAERERKKDKTEKEAGRRKGKVEKELKARAEAAGKSGKEEHGERDDFDEKSVEEGYVAATKEEVTKKSVLDQTLKEAFPEKRNTKEDEKLIEEVLKEYLFNNVN